MNRLFCIAALALITLPAATAWSQTSSERVVVTAQRTAVEAARRDVNTVCPAIADQLPEVLASAWHNVGQEGTVRVQFMLDGQQVRDVQALSGPRRYARWVRSAMGDMNCRADTAQPQAFVFDIRFVDPADLPAQRAVAVLMR
jgi:type II secretory pathway pseudopilin PulG